MSKEGEWISRVYSQPFVFRYYDCASEYEINVFGMMFGVGNENNLITLCSYHHKQAEQNKITKEYLYKLIDIPPGE